MNKIKINLVRHIDRWFIVTDGQRFGFAWGLRNNEVSTETDLNGESGVQWFATRQEAETALLDSLEELFEDGGWTIPETIINSLTFAEMLGVSKQFVHSSVQRSERAKEEGRKYRGKIPAPDLYVDGIPYWFQRTVDFVIENGRKRVKQ